MSALDDNIDLQIVLHERALKQQESENKDENLTNTRRFVLSFEIAQSEYCIKLLNELR